MKQISSSNTAARGCLRAVSVAAWLCVWGAASAQPTLPETVVRARAEQPRWGEQILTPSMTPVPGSDDVSAWLRDIAGGGTLAGGGVSALPVLRGLADERIRLQIDGMDLYAACPNHMNTPLSYLGPAQVESMQVWAGAAPVSAGGDTLGSVLNVRTADPIFAPAGQTRTAGEVGLQARSNDNGRRFSAQAEYATDRLLLRYDGFVAQADNYRAGGAFKDYRFTGRDGHELDTDEVGSTAYLTRNHVLSAAMQNDGHLWEAKVYRQDMPYQLYPNQRMDMLDNESTKLNLRYSGRYTWGRLRAQAWTEDVNHFMDFGADKRYWYGMASGGPKAVNGQPCGPLGPKCAAGMPMYTDSRTYGASVMAEWDLSPHDVVRAGAELHRYRLDDYWPPSGAGMWPGTFWNIRNGHRDRDALVAEWERRQDAWQWVGGVRAERVKTRADDVRGYNEMAGAPSFQARDAAAFNVRDRRRSFDNWDAMLGLRYQWSASLAAEAAFSHRERAPGLYELYPWSTWQMAAFMNNFVGDGNGYIGNLDLRAERANTLSAALNWQDPDQQWGVRVAPYVTRIHDYIDAVQWNAQTNSPAATPTLNKFTVLRYANQSARLYGLDFSAHTLLTRNAWGDWRLRGVLSAVDARNRTTGDGLYGIVPLQARVTLTQRWGGWDNAIEWVGVKAKTRVSQARNEVRTPGYALVNLRVSYRWQDWRFNFGIDNLFDRLYYLPTGGAYVGQGTTMTDSAAGSPRWGTPVPGPGRTLFVGVTRRF